MVLRVYRSEFVGICRKFDGFVEHYMGIRQPIRDNFFCHASPTHRFVSRRNKVNGKAWETRYTVGLQIKGMVTQAVATFVQRMFRQHPWLTWPGLFLSDPLRLLGSPFTCDCNSEAEATLKWKEFEDSTCTAAGSVHEMWQPLPAPATPPNLVQQFRGLDTQDLSTMNN